MANNNNRSHSPSQAYIRSNHDEQPQPESGVDRRKGGGRGKGVGRGNNLKGKPPNWKKKSGHAFQASNSDQGQQLPPSQFPLTMEQLDRLCKLLESPTPSCFIATKGNSAFLSVSLSHTWIVDSGASDHMTGESTLFSSYNPCAGFELGEDDWQC
ncbi:hypothetical protein KIW84_041523 [Lathyrus oleraceus]|uniref:Retrovirus-related Pol polyprotein from transposon TNT 1-94-like beta-barrel domain-containing protein n=1 Tax=Pisum sativum TaxID=3888 RepID=A0A9D4XAE4_PEA|nr:hypothetical protein KIW84_041523 [Pisum sativum]